MLSSSLLLGACSDKGIGLGQENDTDGQTTEQTAGNDTEGNNANITTENQLNSTYYRPLIVDGEYKTSNSRGITLKMNSSVNLKSFETGLMRLSQNYFSTENHLFQEGQFISSDSIYSWLGRESEDNPEGLNPSDNKKTEPDERNPIYLQTILEQDYYRETDEGTKLAGVSIGLGMNQVDYYRKVQFGPEFETQISKEELLKQGQKMANEIVKRMREVEEIGELPIMVGIFEQAPRDNLGGGVYISQGISQNGSGSIGEWTRVNERKEVFPLTGTDSNEGNSFKNFKSEVESFFPNLSGVTGIAHYRDDRLVKLDVNMVTQFYGAGEIIAFTQYVKDAAEKFLTPSIETEITIESMDGVEAILLRSTGGNGFDAHIFAD